MRWSASPVLVVRLARALPPDSGVVAAHLILLERSEPALGAIEQELRPLLPDERAAASAGVCDRPAAAAALVRRAGGSAGSHAAAYKHVPLVEANPLAGLANNVGSTDQVCRAAVANGVGQVVLISTDKAVRPTNVMGASARLAELVVCVMLMRPPATVSPWCVLAMCLVRQVRWCHCSAARSLPVD